MSRSRSGSICHQDVGARVNHTRRIGYGWLHGCMDLVLELELINCHAVPVGPVANATADSRVGVRVSPRAKSKIVSELAQSCEIQESHLPHRTTAHVTRAQTHAHQQSSLATTSIRDISIDPTIPSSLDGCIMTCHDSPLSVHALPHAPPRILGICRRSTAAASLALPRAASTTHRATADRLCARTGNMIMTSLSPWNICPATRTSLRLRAALLARLPWYSH